MKYNEETLAFIKLFEKITDARVKDFYFGERLIFIVNKGDIGKAIGKNGVNIKKFSELSKKQVKVVEYDENEEKFVENLIAPVKGKIYIEDDKIVIKGRGARFKKEVLGANRENLKKYKEIISKYFNHDLEVK